MYHVLPDIKSAEMNVSDLELFKKSKIIEIGSEKKSYGPMNFDFFENFQNFPKNRKIFVLKNLQNHPKSVSKT